MTELVRVISGVVYKSVPEKERNSCEGCCADFGYGICSELRSCDGIIWIESETEMTKEQQKQNQQNKPKTKHVHADLMLEYAKEAMQSDTPWDAFEYKDKDGVWKDCIGSPSWYKDSSFRKKPKTININGYEVPEPLREAPAGGTMYYYPSTSMAEVSYGCYHSGDNYENSLLKHGLIHLTREAAQLHLEALLSFTSEK